MTEKDVTSENLSTEAAAAKFAGLHGASGSEQEAVRYASRGTERGDKAVRVLEGALNRESLPNEPRTLRDSARSRLSRLRP